MEKRRPEKEDTAHTKTCSIGSYISTHAPPDKNGLTSPAKDVKCTSMSNEEIDSEIAARIVYDESPHLSRTEIYNRYSRGEDGWDTVLIGALNLRDEYPTRHEFNKYMENKKVNIRDFIKRNFSYPSENV